MAGNRGKTERQKQRDTDRHRDTERHGDTERHREEEEEKTGGEDTEFKQAAGLGRESSVTGEVSLEGVWRALSLLCQGL